MIAGEVDFRGAFGRTVQAAVRSLRTYAAHLERDLDETVPPGPVLVGGEPGELLAAGPVPHLRLLYLGAEAGPALALGRRLGEGRVVALGLSSYSREERDRLRRFQRLLPLHEIGFCVGARTAALELGEGPVALSLNLNLFRLEAAPEAAGGTHRGLSPSDFFEALPHLFSSRVIAFQLWNEGEIAPGGRTSVLAAEIVRDAILTWR